MNKSKLLIASSPRSLSRLMGRQWDQQRLSADELGGILAEQLVSPIAPELADRHLSSPAKLRTLCGSTEPAIGTFGDLFGHAAPPLELVVMTKDYAKYLSDDPQSSLPPEVGRVLYFASIALAFTRYNKRITALDDRGLREGFKWVLAQAWTNRILRRLIEGTRAALE